MTEATMKEGMEMVTQEMLAGLPEEQAAAIMAEVEAQAREAAGLREERDALAAQLAEAVAAGQAETAAVRGAYDAYRAEVELREKEAAMRRLLADAGANPAVVELLVGQANLAEEALQDGKLARGDELVAAMRQRWGELFATRESEPVGAMNPPRGEETVLSRQVVEGMSLEEINRNWGAVKAALNICR